MEERPYDCSDYSSERCPRGVVTPFTTTEHREIDLIFVGCWGTYCSDETQIFGKQGGRESVTYGSKTVARALEEATTDHSVDAVVLAGDNVYTMPCDMFREMHDPNLDDDQLFVEYKRNFPHARAMQFQMQHGFQDCFANVQASEFIIGIGNHDVINCDLLHEQLNYRPFRPYLNAPKWNLPALYYEKFIHCDECSVQLLVIDTNLYDSKRPTCSGNTASLFVAELREAQLTWVLERLAARPTDRKTWTVVVGHIPMQCIYHKRPNEQPPDASGRTLSVESDYQDQFARQRIESSLRGDIMRMHAVHPIDLYVCADEHNMQLINKIEVDRNPKHYRAVPPQLICGGGGAKLDELQIDERTLSSINRLYAATHFGFGDVLFSKTMMQIGIWDAVRQERVFTATFRSNPDNIGSTVVELDQS